MDIPRPDHPLPQFERDSWLNLNGDWTFAFDPGNSGLERALYDSKGFGDKILVPFCPESKLSGVQHIDFIETMWYHRTFTVPDPWRGKRVLLHFGGVDFASEVFVNGHRVGRHWGGATPFSYDITQFAGNGTVNHLVVRVRDLLRTMTQPAGKQRPEYDLRELRAHYTRTTGIWSTVWLEAVNRESLKRVQIIPDLDESRLIVIPTFTSWGEVGRGATLRVSAALGDSAPVVVSARAAAGVPIMVELADARAWEPGNPQLYDLKFELLDGSGTAVDTVRSYSGLRSVRVEGNKVLLNNKPIYQRLVLDQGFYPDSLWTAPTDADLKRDIELSMAAGFNGARLHQKVFDERFHYWADRLGYLTWAEAPSWGMDSKKIESARNFLSEWRSIVVTQRNHPSVIAWTPLNETRDVEPDPAQHGRFHEDLYDLTKALDPMRPVNDASGYVHVKTDLWTSHNYAQDPATLDSMLDREKNGHVYRNYPQWEADYAGQPYLVDEFGGILWVPEAMRDPADKGVWGYGEGPKTIAEFYSRLEGLIEAVLAQPYISGYCYTQLTDVEQERNGIYTYDRKEKFDMNRVRSLFLKEPKR